MAGGTARGIGAGARLLIALSCSGELEVLAARVGRFYGDGFRWAPGLPVPELVHYGVLMAEVLQREPVQPVVLVKPHGR